MSIVAKKILMGSGAVATPSDDEFNRVSFLSHFDGANNGVNNVFDDGSASNHTITAAGNVTQGSFGPFSRPDGEWGVSFDGDSDYLQVAASSDFDFGTGDFTFECFFFKSDVGNYEYLMSFGNNSESTNSIGLYIDDQVLGVYNNAAITASTTINLNKWYHVAVVRISSTLKIYLDGVEIKSASVSTDISSPGGMNIANWRLAGDAQYFNGVISNARVVKGTGVYTGNFTPSTSKLTAITNTKLLTCQSNRFVDNSATGHTVTPYATSAVTAFGPILTSKVYNPAVNGGSLYNDVNVNGNYLSAADSADWNLGSGNYTVECWAYATAQGSFNKLVGQWPYEGTNAANSWILETVGTDVEAYAIIGGSAVLIAQGAAFTINAWHHVALVRNGNNHNIYIDGVAGSTTSNSGTYYNGTGALEVGSFSSLGGGSWDGYITDVRVVKGTAVYTSNFTPPTAPLTAITNTKLLLNMADGQAIDSAAQNILTLFGNAKISTGQAKFGDTSLYLDGTGDAAQIATTTSAFAFGTGDYTVEMWLYLTAVNANDQIFDMRTADSSVNPGSYLDGSARPNLYISGGVRLTSGTAISANTWTHFAICRAAGTTRIFQAGQVTGTLTSDTYNIVAGKLMLGARFNSAGTNNAQGYWEDVRVSNMARFTSNFTPATEPFADKGR